MEARGSQENRIANLDAPNALVVSERSTSHSIGEARITSFLPSALSSISGPALAIGSLCQFGEAVVRSSGGVPRSQSA